MWRERYVQPTFISLQTRNCLSMWICPYSMALYLDLYFLKMFSCFLLKIFVLMYICMYVCMYVCMHVFKCIFYVCVGGCVCVCILWRWAFYLNNKVILIEFQSGPEVQLEVNDEKKNERKKFIFFFVKRIWFWHLKKNVSINLN